MVFSYTLQILDNWMVRVVVPLPSPPPPPQQSDLRGCEYVQGVFLVSGFKGLLLVDKDTPYQVRDWSMSKAGFLTS